MPVPLGFVSPCLRRRSSRPPGEAWLHEIKHDGFRVVDAQGRHTGEALQPPRQALAGLRSRSCIIDGEAVCCGDNGVPSFDRIRYRRHDASVFLYAFDLIELNGDDLRRETFETRKATLTSLLKRASPGLRLNEHIEADGPTVFAHACKMGLEGIVSKRKASPYRSGRSSDWLKSKNPACEAVRREAEEDWGQ
jgi:bifunctional non-homologous end joining protein LigD